MYTNILVPFDGSEPAQHAVEAAVQLASGSPSANITVLKVTGPANFDRSTFEVAARMAGFPEIDKKMAQDAKKNFIEANKRQMQEQIEDFFAGVPDNVGIKIVVKAGKPHEVICQYARENHCDCIVMGRRGLGAIQAAFGSTSFAVLRSIDLPVLVVK